MIKRFDRAAAGLWAGLALAALGALAVLSGSSSVQTAAQGGPAAPAPELANGWFAIVSAASVKEKARIHAPGAEFALQKDQTLVPGYPAAFSVAYSGTVTLEKAGKYRFAVLGQGGKAKLTVFGAKGATRLGQAESSASPGTTEWITGDGSAATLSVTFDRTASGETRLQTYWERQGTPEQGGFYREPIPMHAVQIPAYAAREMAASDSALHGRMLLGEMKCVACHIPEDKAMTALKAPQAPLLGEIGRRASPEWIRH
jgi:hypothetical protein